MEQRFLFACCQVGGEPMVKAELARNHPDWRFSFSRPGFVTFKWQGDETPSLQFQLKSNFARTFGWSLGPMPGDDEADRRQYVVERCASQEFRHLHIWGRPFKRPHSTVPDPVSEEIQQFGERLCHQLHDAGILTKPEFNCRAKPGNRVLDICSVARGQWWMGDHDVSTFGQQWPGGVPQLKRPSIMVSRAYLKMTEMLMWSGLPVVKGDHCVEIGSAPGGASQALLERELVVTGVDPAAMDPKIDQHKNFTHVRKRGVDLRREAYAGYRWLMVDANVPPAEVLDMVESIVRHRATRVEGMLLTLKLATWDSAQQIGDWVERVSDWGYRFIRCKQLATNHREVCLAAMRSRRLRRTKHKKRRRRTAITPQSKEAER